MSVAFKNNASPDAEHDRGGAPHLSNSASPGKLATPARIVEAGHKPFSVLAINSGSSSLRFSLFTTGESLTRILTGKFERIGLPDAGVSLTDVRANQSNERRIDAPNHVAGVSPLFELLEQTDASRVTVRVIRTDEELMIARSVIRVLHL